MKKISIIIPVYNTGEYLKKCIDSILSQEFKDFELILVNDGSTDNSGYICDEYANKDNRIKVIHKENEGVSIARNCGIGISSGEYIGFVDSDDWLQPDMYYKLYSLAKENGTDIVMCDAATKYDDKPDEQDTITQLEEDVLLKKADITPSLLCEIAGSAWRCIYKSDLLKVNKISFPVGIPLAEDRIFNIMAIGMANGIYYKKLPLYNRYVRSGSAVYKYYNDMCSIIKKVYNGYMASLEMWDNNQEYKLAYKKQIVYMSYRAINNAFFKDSPKNLYEKYNEIKTLCNCDIVRDAIKITQSTDIRSKLILRKHVFLLSIVSVLLNKKHRS